MILPAIAFAIWLFRARRRDDDLGSVSAQWLHDYRRESHQER